MRIRIADELNMEKTLESGQAFRSLKLEDGSYFFLHRGAVLQMRHLGGAEWDVSATQDAWREIWHLYFDLDRDYRALRRRALAAGGFLAHAAEVGEGIRILRQDPWEMLLTFILSQRKNLPAIRKGVQALAAQYGKPVPPSSLPVTLSQPAFYFPTPMQMQRATETELRALGMGYRAPYLVDAIQKVASGELDLIALERLSTQELLEALQTVHGVGIKVANCVALYGFGRMTGAPVDVWIARAIERHFDGENPFFAFGDAAGVFQQYIFYTMREESRQGTGIKEA